MPFILAVVYILTYSYASQFLAQFGLTPEAVGISEAELLTRVGFLGLVVISTYGLLLVVPSLVVGVVLSVLEGKRPRSRLSGSQSDAEAIRRDRIGRIASTTVFALVVLAIIWITDAFGIQPKLAWTIFLGALSFTLVAAFYLRYTRRAHRSFILRSAVVIGFIVLGWSSYFGGADSGVAMAEHGRIPQVTSAFGVDVLEVHPVWLDKDVIPSRYLRGQDLLTIGSDSGSVFLYDCFTGATYRIPLGDVVLTYPLSFNGESSPPMQDLLRCG